MLQAPVPVAVPQGDPNVPWTMCLSFAGVLSFAILFAVRYKLDLRKTREELEKIALERDKLKGDLGKAALELDKMRLEVHRLRAEVGEADLRATARAAGLHRLDGPQTDKVLRQLNDASQAAGRRPWIPSK